MTASISQLILIGTVHRDPQGHQNLASLLEQLQPDLLTLEMSPFALEYRRSRGRRQMLRLERILQRLSAETGRPLQELKTCRAVIDIQVLLAMPYEYRATRKYADRHQCRLVLIDVSEVSAHKLRRVESELTTYHNLKTLVSLPDEGIPLHQESYATAQLLLQTAPGDAVCEAFLRRRRGPEGVGRRDQVMADQLRRLRNRHPGRRLVHVGGWVHLLEDPHEETLFSRLADLSPQRRLLVERIDSAAGEA